ncbi:MAG: mannose-6-phosphate isomerase [Planctomycetes bacterium]|nr:mannose-6-phosphate isomerase [Planctomycetota bacterium]
MKASNLYPFKLSDVFHEKIWGGQRLRSVCGKNLPRGKKIGESWEVCDYQTEVNVVREGAYEGSTIRKLLQAMPEDILGPAVARKYGPTLPLLFKFIDANDVISVQVHPDDQHAATQHHEDYGKAEGWYVVYAEPGAKLILGLKADTTRKEFERCIENDEVEKCLNWISVKKGDAIFLPPGTVHAIGPGIIIAEIQETSDLTCRLYDWDRMAEEGRPRPLHVEEALSMVDFAVNHTGKEKPKKIGKDRLRLIECDKFVYEKLEVRKGPINVGGTGSFEILSAIRGRGVLTWPGGETPMALGETVLLPACIHPCSLRSDEDMEILRSYCPAPG